MRTGRHGLRLGVNIDHVATLRQARGTRYPDPLEAARLCARAGADGITVHLREDRRHIQEADVRAIRRSARIAMNLEMAVVPEIIRIALDVKPDEVCLVPERRAELTTEGGLDAAGQLRNLSRPVAALRDAGICVSLFINPDQRQVRAAAELGAPVIELHTGRFCDLQEAWRMCSGSRSRRHLLKKQAEGEKKRLISAAVAAHEAGIQVNAGHGINLQNIRSILNMPYLDTLNIGHSIVARAVMIGMPEAVREMKACMAEYRGGEHVRRR